MANFIVSYDLNGPRPSHREMDEHLEESGWTVARVLETVWYVGADATPKEVHDYVKLILSGNDRSIVVEGKDASLNKLLCGDRQFVEWWNAHR